MTAGVERQQTSYNKRFSFAFIMIHEACVLLYVFHLLLQWVEIKDGRMIL